MIAQKQSPLAAVGNRRRLRHDVGNRQAIFLAQRHVDARHQRKVKGHVALVAIAEVGTHIGRPLVGFGKNEAVGIVRVDRGADLLDDRVCLGQVLAGGAVALTEIGNRIHAQRVHAHVEPEAHGLQHLFHHQRIVEVEIRLMRKEAMPVVSLRGFIPGPVRFFRVGKDDARVFVELVGIGPDIHVALRRARRRKPRRLEPRMLIAGVIDDQLDHHLHVALVRRIEEALEVAQRAVGGIHIDIVCNVVAVIAQRRREEGQQPDAGDAEVLQIIEP